MKKLWYIYTMEYYTVEGKKEFLTSSTEFLFKYDYSLHSHIRGLIWLTLDNPGSKWKGQL